MEKTNLMYLGKVQTQTGKDPVMIRNGSLYKTRSRKEKHVWICPSFSPTFYECVPPPLNAVKSSYDLDIVDLKNPLKTKTLYFLYFLPLLYCQKICYRKFTDVISSLAVSSGPLSHFGVLFYCFISSFLIGQK